MCVCVCLACACIYIFYFLLEKMTSFGNVVWVMNISMAPDIVVEQETFRQ